MSAPIAGPERSRVTRGFDRRLVGHVAGDPEGLDNHELRRSRRGLASRRSHRGRGWRRSSRRRQECAPLRGRCRVWRRRRCGSLRRPRAGRDQDDVASGAQLGCLAELVKHHLKLRVVASRPSPVTVGAIPTPRPGRRVSVSATPPRPGSASARPGAATRGRDHGSSPPRRPHAARYAPRSTPAAALWHRRCR